MGHLQLNINFQGSDYRWFPTNSAESCSNDCAAEAACQAMTFTQNTQGGGVCWLKNAVPQPFAVSGMTSAVKLFVNPY
jgi:hypothetical protein